MLFSGTKPSIALWKRIMHQTVDRSKIESVKWLLTLGIGDVNERLRDGFTALHYAKTPGKGLCLHQIGLLTS